MPANIRETIIGIGLVKQADLTTANITADFRRWNKLNGGLMDASLGTESDADEIGKGHEFATALYKTGWDVSGSFEKYLSAEWLSMVLAFAFGKSTVTGAGPYEHGIELLDPLDGGIELPSFSVVEQIRPGGNSVVDRMAVGCAIEEFTLSLGTGPTRASSKLSCNFIGSGILIEPSNIVLPAAPITENLLPAAGLSLSLNGIDYVSNKSLVSLELTYKNNHDANSGYFPGSGFQTPGDGSSGAVRGRLEHGDRVLGLRWVARYEHGSSEYTKFKALSSGTGTIGLAGANGVSATITLQKMAFGSVKIQETDKFVTAAVEASVLYHPTNGLVNAVISNGLAKIAAEA